MLGLAGPYGVWRGMPPCPISPLKKSDEITCRYSVDPDFVFSSCFESKHLKKTNRRVSCIINLRINCKRSKDDNRAHSCVTLKRSFCWTHTPTIPVSYTINIQNRSIGLVCYQQPLIFAFSEKILVKTISIVI